MTYYVAVFSVHEEVLAEEDLSFSGECGWLEASGIYLRDYKKISPDEADHFLNEMNA